jgi:acyl-CoA thioester hydrolase
MARDDYRVNHELRPRFRDTDAMGHVNNAVYVSYLEVGRQAYWAELTGGADYRLVPFTLAHVTCDFRSEALVNEVLEVGIRCEWIGTRSFAFSYEIREQASGRVVVEATTVQVCYDYAAKRTMPMPDELRRRLQAFEGRALERHGARRG